MTQRTKYEKEATVMPVGSVCIYRVFVGYGDTCVWISVASIRIVVIGEIVQLTLSHIRGSGRMLQCGAGTIDVAEWVSCRFGNGILRITFGIK